MGKQGKQPKHPAVAAVVAVAMKNLKVTGSRQLADVMGWVNRDGERRARRLVNGEVDPQFSSIAAVLSAGNVFTEEARLVIERDPMMAAAVAAARLAQARAEEVATESERHAQDGQGTAA